MKYIIFTILLAGGLGVLFMMDSEGDYDVAPVSVMPSPDFQPPVNVPVHQMMEQSRINIEPLSNEEKILKNFEFKLRKSQFEASIAENNNKARKLAAEAAKDAAELENIKAEGRKMMIEAEAKKLISEAEIRARESAKQYTPPAPVAPTESQATSLSSEPKYIPEVNNTSISVNRITGEQVTLTVNGRIGVVRIGSAFSGFVIQSIGQDRRSVLVKNIISGKLQTLHLPANDSRRFANPQPIGTKAKNGDVNSQSVGIQGMYKGE